MQKKIRLVFSNLISETLQLVKNTFYLKTLPQVCKRRRWIRSLSESNWVTSELQRKPGHTQDTQTHTQETHTGPVTEPRLAALSLTGSVT